MVVERATGWKIKDHYTEDILTAEPSEVLRWASLSRMIERGLSDHAFFALSARSRMMLERTSERVFVPDADPTSDAFSGYVMTANPIVLVYPTNRAVATRRYDVGVPATNRILLTNMIRVMPKAIDLTPLDPKRVRQSPEGWYYAMPGQTNYPTQISDDIQKPVPP